MYGSEIPLALQLPELPGHWQECFGAVGWLVVVPGTETIIEVPAGCTQPQGILLPKRQHQPVLAFPLPASGSCGLPAAGFCRLPPAAAVFPLDLAADRTALVLSWEQAPLGELLHRLLRQGVEVETLNVPRLCREIQSRFPADPWSLDVDAAAAALVTGCFRVTDLRPLASRTVALELGPGRWFLESPFFVPVVAAVDADSVGSDAAACSVLLVPDVPLGFHRLFEVDTGWVADLWVDERRVLRIPARRSAKPARRSAKPARRSAKPARQSAKPRLALTGRRRRRHSEQAMFFLIGGLEPRREVLDPGPLPCPSCGKRAARIEQVRSYLSLFFIPLIPVRRGEPYLVCERCGAVRPLRGDDAAGFPEAYSPETYEGLDQELAGELEDDGPLTCAECGGPVEPEFDYCPYCGTRLKG